MNKSFICIDDFYNDPDEVRDFALDQEYTTSGNWTDARDELRDFYEKDEKGLERQRIYGPRRNKEAAYLEQDNLLGTKAY